MVSAKKMAKPIEMPFGVWTQVGTGSHVLDGGPDFQTRRANFDGRHADTYPAVDILETT